MKTIPIFLVDSFAGEPFKGNPAGVVVLEQPADAAWMQKVAMEMNQAETAFIVPLEKGFGLRWFTPTVEVDLCGHATLASAHILWKLHTVPKDQTISFETRSGWLHCTRQEQLIQLDFPAKVVEPCEEPEGLFAALGLIEGTIYFNKMDYLIVVPEETIVRLLKPNFAELFKLECRGVIVSAQSAANSSVDFVSRFFAPGSGIPEDPVTGSAHCALGPYWAKALGKNPLVGYQASPRGGYVHVEVKDDRVLLRGTAVTFLKGEIRGN
ncbi:MAG TPA: PhzF family phenazine biosynthesis protein [Gemmatales bacterium]|nr:PhzF family phenazine biosynthesis protein [Gemmatales bacterium]